MADDVLINFVGDTSRLQPAEDALENMITLEGEVGAAWKKTSETINSELKNQTAGTNKLSKSIEAMATAAKSMDKVVIAGAYKQYLKEIQAQLGLTNKELIAYVQTARKAAQQQIFSAQDQKEIDDLNLSIEVMNDQLKQLEAQEERTGEKTKSLRTQIREAKEELVAMAEAGLQGTPAFAALQQKAGQLDDQMRDLNQTVKGLGSDTKNIDGLISLASGVAGGFAVAQGTMALFGSESEDVQKALLKVNAAMAILQGLQQLQTVLQKESAASILFNTGARQAQTAATVTQVAAEGAQVVATEAATVAQVELNTAMSLNPVGLIIVGILAAVAAFSAFSEETETAAEKTERLTKEAEDLYEALQKISKVNQIRIDRQIDIVENEELVKKLEAQGGAIEEINRLKKIGLDLQNQELNNELNNIKAAQEKAEDKTQFTERELAVRSEIYKNSQQQLLLDIETNKVLAERALKSATGSAEAEIARRKIVILQNQTDSIASIQAVTDAEIDAIKKRRAEELNNNQLTSGEREKIIQESNLRILELQKANQRKLLDIQKSDINAKLQLAQKGSEQEYQLNLDLLQKEKEKELQEAELTAAQIAEIKAKYQKQADELDRKFAEQKIQNEISYLNSYIDAFGISENRKLELTIRRLDRQRDLEISQAEGNAAKIAEINAKYDNIILETKKAAIKKELDEKLRALDVYNAQVDAAAKRSLSNDNTTLDQKIQASNKILQIEMDRIQAEEDAIKKQYAAGTLTAEQYSLEIQDIANKRADAEIAANERVSAAILKESQKSIAKLRAVFDLFSKGLSSTLGQGAFATAVTELESFAAKTQEILAQLKAGTIKTIDAIKAVASSAIATAQQVITQIFADASARRQQIVADEIAALEEQKQRELNAKNLTEQQKADIEDRYRQREKKIKIEAFNADKQAKRSQALINGALAATLAFAQYAWPYSLIVAGIIAGLTGIEVAEINRQQPPRFKTGKVNIDGPGTSTSDSIHAMISKGESVINAPATAKWSDALEAINQDKFEQYLTSKINDFIFPKVPDNVSTAPVMLIDYTMLARSVAAEMKGVIPAPASLNLNINEDGLKSWIETGSSRTEIKNQRYSMS